MTRKAVHIAEKIALWTFAFVLGAAAILKAVSLSQGDIHGWNDVFPLSNFTLWCLVVAAELAACALLVFSSNRLLAHFVTVSMASFFILYRILLGLSGPQKSCGCLGNVDRVPILQAVENNLWIFVAVMFLTGLLGLFLRGGFVKSNVPAPDPL